MNLFTTILLTCVAATTELKSHDVQFTLLDIDPEINRRDIDEVIILDDNVSRRRSLKAPQTKSPKEEKDNEFQDKSSKKSHHKSAKSKMSSTSYVTSEPRLFEISDELDKQNEEALRKNIDIENDEFVETELTDYARPLETGLILRDCKELDKTTAMCIRACNRAHEDVCDRLKCSPRSVRALKKECTLNCKKVFDPQRCYKRRN